jgi:hypothetical protein
MSILRRRGDERTVEPERNAPPKRLTRAQRKARKAEEAAAAELAARIARAQRRLAQATGPLPVVAQRGPAEDRVPGR